MCTNKLVVDTLLSQYCLLHAVSSCYAFITLGQCCRIGWIGRATVMMGGAIEISAGMAEAE